MYENEQWIPAIGYETKYEVSNYGRVRRIDLAPYDSRGRVNKSYGRIFEPHPANNGYTRISIGTKRDYTHRIVAQHFLPNPNNYPVVNHIDGDKTNNYVGNLEWCSQKYNAMHASATGLINRTSEKRKQQAKYNLQTAYERKKKPVLQLNAAGNILREFECAADAEEAMCGKRSSHIAVVAKGNSYHRSAYGYQWVYKEDYDPNCDYQYHAHKGQKGFELQ